MDLASFFTMPPGVLSRRLGVLVTMFTPSTSTWLRRDTDPAPCGLLGILIVTRDHYDTAPFLMLNFGLNRLLIYIALSLLFFLSIRPPYAAPPHPAGRPGPRGAVNYLQNFRRQGDDLHISLVTQFPGHWPENTGSAGSSDAFNNTTALSSKLI